nr:uncharacterized protein C7orf31 homolog isoform X3 [Gasterosteus aculeatus aculeatus]
MVSKASLNHGIPTEFNSHHDFGCGETNIPERTTSQHRFNNSGSKNSKVRLNDQLIPKPTDINMAEKMTKIPTPKQHPYSSHISKFAMFPSFHSPDDHETGVAHNITVLRKTKGGPYRHEVLETPMQTRKKAVTWTGEHRSLDPLNGEDQVLHPAPPKAVLPNPKPRAWDLSLSERTSNMLKNLERSRWVTSYQMHHTGSGPANPLMMDDFKEKICDLTGMNSLAVPLRERSFPVFIPSKPRGGCRRRQRESCSPTAIELPNHSQAPNQCSPPAAINQQGQPDISAKFNETPHTKQQYHSQSEHMSGSSEEESSKVFLHKQPSRSSLYESRERENGKLQLCPSPVQESLSQISQKGNISGPEPPLETELTSEKSLTKLCGGNLSTTRQSSVVKELTSIGSNAKLSSRAASEQERAKGGELPGTTSNPSILPRPPVLPGIRPLYRVRSEGREALCLLDLQNSFSKSKAHHEFNCCITRAAVNLRDNVVTGKKHDFYGINCYHLHG